MTEIDQLLAEQPLVRFEVTLEPEQIRSFQDQGYLEIGRITSDEELAWLGALYDHLFAEHRSGITGGYFDLTRPYDSAGPDRLPQILLPEKAFPQLRETALFHNGRRVAARLLGVDESALEGGGHMIQKPALYGTELPWHQDEAYWDPRFTYDAVGVWMPLDDATLESGCLQFIPGSHRSAVLPHRHLGGDPSVHGLVTDAVDPSRAVAVAVPAGHATVHHCRTLHYSGPNRTDHPRRAYTNEFQAPLVRCETPPERPWIEQTKLGWARRELG